MNCSQLFCHDNKKSFINVSNTNVEVERQFMFLLNFWDILNAKHNEDCLTDNMNKKQLKLYTSLFWIVFCAWHKKINIARWHITWNKYLSTNTSKNSQIENVQYFSNNKYDIKCLCVNSDFSTRLISNKNVNLIVIFVLEF